MQGARYGEQTQIAYTQSPLIAALEVTDLEDSSRRGSATFFNGTRTDYPRQMHLIQGSNAHRLTREGARRDTDLGIGDRAMELMLPTARLPRCGSCLPRTTSRVSAPGIPYRNAQPIPCLRRERAAPTITQAFHEQARSRRSGYRPVLKDVVAFANTQGGTIYLGLSRNPAAPVVGVPLVDEVVRGLRDAVTRSVVPRLDVTVDIENVMGKTVIVVRVPKGPDTPYATEAGQVFVRQNGETVIALRDEIVQLVQESTRAGNASDARCHRASASGLRRAPRSWTSMMKKTATAMTAVTTRAAEPPRAAPLPVHPLRPSVPSRVSGGCSTGPAHALAAVRSRRRVSRTTTRPPAQVTPAPTPEPAPAPAPHCRACRLTAPAAPVPRRSPRTPPIITDTFDTAPSVDTLVETVPGTSHPVEIPREAAVPGGGTGPAVVATTGSEAADITEAIEAESPWAAPPATASPEPRAGCAKY